MWEAEAETGRAVLVLEKGVEKGAAVLADDRRDAWEVDPVSGEEDFVKVSGLGQVGSEELAAPGGD